jgi:hypothetical protein
MMHLEIGCWTANGALEEFHQGSRKVWLAEHRWLFEAVA